MSRETLTAVTAERGAGPLQVGVFPRAVRSADTDGRHARRVSARGDTLTFDQMGRTGELVAQVRGAGSLGDAPQGWSQLRRRVAQIRSNPRAYPAWLTILGNSCMTAGIAVVFGARWWSLLADAVFGLLVGAAPVWLSRAMRLAQLLPFLTAFIVTVLLWHAGMLAGAQSIPLFAVRAPLVVLIPGATVTNAVIELTAGDVVSGGGRLISGLVVWALLGAGIATGAALVGAQLVGGELAPAGVAAPSVGSCGTPGLIGGAGAVAAGGSTWGAAVPAWLVWPAVVLVCVGVGLFCSARLRLTAVIVGVLLLTYTLVRWGEPRLGTIAVVGVVAAVVLAATRALEAWRPAYPSVVVFRPAYWPLVPGSFGLVALTSDAGDPDLIRITLATIIALTIRTQVGAIVVEAAAGVARRRRRLAGAARGRGRRGVGSELGAGVSTRYGDGRTDV